MDTSSAGGQRFHVGSPGTVVNGPAKGTPRQSESQSPPRGGTKNAPASPGRCRATKAFLLSCPLFSTCRLTMSSQDQKSDLQGCSCKEGTEGLAEMVEGGLEATPSPPSCAYALFSPQTGSKQTTKPPGQTQWTNGAALQPNSKPELTGKTRAQLPNCEVDFGQAHPAFPAVAQPRSLGPPSCRRGHRRRQQSAGIQLQGPRPGKRRRTGT